MRIKISHVVLICAVLCFASVSFAASPAIKLNEEAHVGERVVLEADIPLGNSIEWSVSPTTGKTPDRISVRSNGHEFTFIPLDTQPIKVVASLVDRNGEIVSTNELIVTPKEFKIDVEILGGEALKLWDASKRTDYTLDSSVLMANVPIKIRANLKPAFKGSYSLTWTADAATALLSPDKGGISIRRGSIGDSEIYVKAFNSYGTMLGTGSGVIKITLPYSTFENSSRDRTAWQNWQKAQELWTNKNYAQAVELAKSASDLSPRDPEISEGFRSMNMNFARFNRAVKLREAAAKFDSEKKLDEALKNLRAAQVIWPLDNGEAEIKAAEKKVDDFRELQQKANWLRDTASAYDNEGMFEDALEYYEQSLALVPSQSISERAEKIRNRLALMSDADKYAAEGSKLEREGKLQEALNHYTASVMSNPDVVLHQHIEELQNVIARRERQANILYREGQDQQRRNKIQEAMRLYTESINMWPTENAQNRLRQLSRGNRLAAGTVIRTPEDFGIGTRMDSQRLIQAADKLYSEGKVQEAIATYKRAIAITPSDGMKNWVTRLEDTIKENAAVETANKQIKEANALYRAGKVKEALELYRKSLTTHKNAEIEAFLQKQVQK